MPDRFDVAIVGCGPSGAALANLLGQAGLAVVVLAHHPGHRDSPALAAAIARPWRRVCIGGGDQRQGRYDLQ